ncbi:MAG: DNA repair protein RadA [Deltaproteobacteria bacterium]|nr:DNA repair protein RadA [Deltaproteobacteria bacterium]MBI2211958.1 DNA repair protein RadA [Deltaproteobacteria bacterium]MBI2348145.1 DNA repair protein RadA [Deltaproteobacteria bacterium]
MAKPKIIYACQSCGYQSPKWLGKCPDCNQWNTLVEERIERSTHRRDELTLGTKEEPAPINEISTAEEGRILSGIGEFDRVLGGGLVPGSVTLIGGDPGIGKSTLLLQAFAALSQKGLTCLYISGEESPRQIKMRAERLGVAPPTLLILSETSLEKIIEQIKKIKPAVLVIDSVQTIFTSSLPSAPGSIGQVRESSGSIIVLAKKSGLSTFLIGHVTKDGALAGPRMLEHMVDTVLYFEGERGHNFRVLRAVKNRFGSTNEIGVFEMKEAGLREVANPSELFLSERPLQAPGSAVVCSMEGTRPILVELQALVSPTFLAVPRRTTIGVDHNRVALLVAVLEKKLGIKLFNKDIFVNVAGGVQVDEPAVDLGIIAAVASSHEEKALDPQAVFFGEVGLAGEIRAISQAEARVKEAGKLGFKRCILPPSNSRQLNHIKSPELSAVSSLAELWEMIF